MPDSLNACPAISASPPEFPGKGAGAGDNSFRDDLSYTQRPRIWPPHQDATAVFRSPRLNYAIDFPFLQRAATSCPLRLPTDTKGPSVTGLQAFGGQGPGILRGGSHSFDQSEADRIATDLEPIVMDSVSRPPRAYNVSLR